MYGILVPVWNVGKIMSKYDLEAIPVVNDSKELLGRITIDDIVDVIKEEADKDYQLAAGISADVEADDKIFDLVKARDLFLTFLVKVDPAPTTAFFPILIGATSEVFDPINAPSEILVLFFFLPS